MSLKSTNLRVLLTLIVLLTAGRLAAQPGIGISYTVSQPQMPMPTLTAATALFTTTDETLSVVTKPAGFLFTYGGRSYDGIVVSSNGWLALVPQGQATVPGLTAGPANNLANHPASVGASVPVIAPLWDNLKSTSVYTYAGGILTVRWTAVNWDPTSTNASSFGVQLNTATGGIKFVYTTVLIPTNPSASVGITGPCAGDYYSWKLASDYTYSPSVAGTAGSSTLTMVTVANLAIGNLVIPTTPLLTLTAAATASNTLTFSSTATIAVGMFVNGPGIPAGTTITSIVSATQITISNNVTLNVGTSLNFSYLPQGTTITGISGTTLTFSNPLAAAPPTTASFRFVTTAVDSTQEFNTVGSGTSSNRPTAFYLDWTPSTPWNDNCNATPPTVGGKTPNLGTISSSTCTPLTWATTHATASVSGALCGGATKDVWFVVTKPAGVGNFIIRTTASTCGLSASVAGTEVEVFSGTCGALVSVGCSSTGTSGSGTFGEVAVTGNACSAASYLVRVAGDNNESGKFDICAVADVSAGANCTSAIVVPSIPQSYTCVSTAGAVNDYSSNGCNAGYNGEDLVYSFTPTNSTCINIATSGGTGSNAGIFVFDGCPGASNCVAFATSATTVASLNNLSVAAGTTYYIVIDNQSGALSNINVNITASPNPVPPNDNPAGAVNVPIFPSCTPVNSSTLCASPTPTSVCASAAPTCGGFSSAAVDVWFTITVPATGAVVINTAAGSAPAMTDAAMAVYNTSCSGPLLACNDDLTGTFPGMTLTGLMPGSTIYVRVWAKPGTALGNFSICATSCSPVGNDNCSSATNLGTPVAGVCSSASSSTACAGGSATPAAPPCGNYAGSDVWFRVTAPANGIINVSITPGTTGTAMTNPAFAVYTGASCGTLTLVGCSDQSGSSFDSLTPGATYYIRVWPEAGSVPGTFDICAATSCLANDECYSATPLSVGTTPVYIAGTNACATTSCGAPRPTCINFSSGLGSALITAAGSGYGANQTYTGVQVSGFAGGTGATVTVTTDANGAIATIQITNGGFGYFPNLPTTAGCLSGGLVVGTGTPALPAPTAQAVINFGASPGRNDVWYSVVVPASGGLVVTMQTGTLTDPVMEVYTGNCGSLTAIRCDDDGGPGLASEVSYCQGQLTPGQTVYVRVWPYSRFTTDGTFQIAAYDPGPNSAPNPYQADDPCQITQNFPVSSIGNCIYTNMSFRCTTPTNYGTTYTAGATAGTSSNTITLTSAAGVTVGMNVVIYPNNFANPLPQGTFVTAIAGNTITLSNLITNQITAGTSIIITGLPDPYNCWPFGNGTYGSTGYLPSNDIWVRVVVPAGITGMTFTTQSGTIYDDNLAVYRPNPATGCSTMTQLGCDDLNGPGLMPELSLGGLTPGETLYVRHYNWFGGTTRTGDFSFCVEASCSQAVLNDEYCPNGTLGAIPLTVGSSCAYQGPYTTVCASSTPIPSGPPAPACGNFVTSCGSGRDVWFTAVIPPSGQITIDMQSISIPDAALAVYSPPAVCSSTTGWTILGCDDNSSTNLGMPYLTVTATAGSTVYIRVWAKNCLTGQFSLCVFDPCPLGIPPNDDPCSAIVMAAGITYNGYNSCATSAYDPPGQAPYVYPSCWTVGSANTVWYKFVPTNDSVYVTTTLGTLTNTQIAIYSASGLCSSVPAVPLSCNDNYQTCGFGTNASQILATGLTPGNPYYVVLDGYQSLTGTFSISYTEVGLALPPTPQQDCPAATLICSDSIVFSAPGFIGTGNYCDLGPGGTSNYGCIPGTGARENNSAWFYFNIGTTGLLEFDITPTTGAANYDWALWNITGLTGIGGAPNSTACAQVLANTQPVVSCNWSNDLVTTSASTGMNGSGSCINCNVTDPPYASPLTVTAGETYLLMINNSPPSPTSTVPPTPAGFTLSFQNSNVLSLVASNPLNWSGGSNNQWNNPSNWGGCGTPACANGATIMPGLVQPVIPTGANDTVQNLTISPGATLTLAPGATLNVCGNFTNNGALVASPTSTVRFIGNGNTQFVSGNFTGSSRFGNFIVDKPGGEVRLMNNVDIGGSFTTANGTSILNMNNKYVKVFRSFTNFNGNTTITGAGTGAAGSTLEFAGGIQLFTNTGSNLVLNNVVMNQASGTSTLTLTNNGTSNLICGTGGILTLNKGQILTGTTCETVVMNTATGAVVQGVNNTNLFFSSFVNGWLRRYFGTAGATPFSYIFPVGNTATGAQLAELRFTTLPTSAYQLAMRFLSWGGGNLPLVNGPFPPLECGVYDWSIRPALAHGYWNSVSSTSTPTGTYDLTVYNNLSTYGGVNVSNAYPSSGQGAASNVIPFAGANITGLTVGMNVVGPYIPAGATLVSFTATSITISTPTTSPILPGSNVYVFTSGATGRLDALTIMKDSTGTGVWRMEATCPCNNTYPPPVRPYSKRYQYDATTTGFTNYATVQFATALPVELIEFTAEQAEGGNLCRWSTASETDNDYFDVERSYDGENFSSIGTVEGYGPGTTSSTRNYSLLDKHPCNGIVYYRLRQVDINGIESYSDVVVLNCMRSKSELVLFPNPASEKVTYTFFENTDGIIDVEMIDMLGNTVKFERFSVEGGYNSLRTSISDLAPGIYFLRVQRLDRTGDARLIRFTKQ